MWFNISTNVFDHHHHYMFFLYIVLFVVFVVVDADDPHNHLTFSVTYGNISPLGVNQQVILINGLFPGPDIHAVTNDNLLINVFNHLPEPFLITWNGVQQRKNSWQDGVYGTNCPIPPGRNFTYTLQVKDQIGSFFYFPSLGFHKAAGGFGGFRIVSRPGIPVPFPEPASDYTLLIGDWYWYDHQHLRNILDRGRILAPPAGILMNGYGPNGPTFRVEQGKTYRFRISNVGLQNSLNIRIQGHTMKLVEVEGTHTVPTTYSSLDVHVGQSYSVLVTADQPASDYYIAVSTRFTTPVLSTTAILSYRNSAGLASGPIPNAPTNEIEYSLNQARSISMEGGIWTPGSRVNYNRQDAISRSTVQVYPHSWTAVYVALDNVGMWNLRSEIWARSYLGQQFYLRVYSKVKSTRNEYTIPGNVLLCGRAIGRRI
ncbi:hypothetical protein AQUCO_00700844v1 [Aquilegia coerulea]|uniref:Plastocyanin-like domain-containing protein n=1 Tax=Aquilegia coerulea TaxID=218851 RepID=A0A2G5EM08_AQUCA|nr:hypothetical protein AQUCO_00700844v1 [Aquilegia coerulea]